jgi:Ca-activated chloride channel homolog
MRRMSQVGWVLFALGVLGCAQERGKGASPASATTAAEPAAVPLSLDAPEKAAQPTEVAPSPSLPAASPNRSPLAARPSAPKGGSAHKARSPARHFAYGSGGSAPKVSPAPVRAEPLGEGYAGSEETGFKSASAEPLSTFSIDTDTASYANVRRFLKGGQLPPTDAVRVEEMVNYFSYAYPQPTGNHPFSGSVEVAACPWNSKHLLARIGLKGRFVPPAQRKNANLVFLIDVSGSMAAGNKLPLLQRSLSFAVDQLKAQDRVAIVVYAGASGVVLPSTQVANRERIQEALASLRSGGSTNGGEGIERAYELAQEHFNPGAINRVILATDGDFNVGVTSHDELVGLVKRKAKSGVFLTVLGFGMGNLKDDTLEKLADNGNGSYAYIDDFVEARKVFGTQMGATLETIAKDVKIQVQLDPKTVSTYRLLGYENRRLTTEDFRNDAKDAGEIGAGHRVTAFYELVPHGTPATGKELMTVRVRYKQPNGSTGVEGQFPLLASGKAFGSASPDFRFAAAVASFGLVLANSEHKGNATFDSIAAWAQSGKGDDPFGHRAEFIDLVHAAKRASGGDARVASLGCSCAPGDVLCSCD